jgi:transcriptional regulator with XRE-family HTH domain
MELKDRIQAAMQHSGLGKAELAARSRVSKAAVTHWLDGSTKSLKAHKAESLATATGVSVKWLVTGLGLMVQPPAEKPELGYHHVAQPPSPPYANTKPEPGEIKKALQTLAAALAGLDMAGRQQIAPLFESFARAPGQVIIDDITDLLKETRQSKSNAAEKAA